MLIRPSKFRRGLAPFIRSCSNEKLIRSISASACSSSSSAIVLFRDSPHVYSIEQPSLNLSVRYLPFYALASVSRMIAAMILSLIIGLLAGYMAAVSRRWNMLILPAADILQSVPVLGFFPAAVFLFIRIFGTSYPAIGVEIAAIFLIITSALWNLIFAVYESVTTIPE